MADRRKVIIVHTLVQAQAALEIAVSLKKPVLLQSAPGALGYAGSLYLLNLFTQAMQAFPQAEATCILDCGDMAGYAIGAITDGHKHLRADMPPEGFAKLQSIAGQYGATLYTSQPEALDLQLTADIREACRQWLLCD